MIHNRQFGESLVFFKKWHGNKNLVKKYVISSFGVYHKVFITNNSSIFSALKYFAMVRSK